MKASTALFTTLLLAAFILVACATLPPQSRPTSPEPFYGMWTGTWQSYNNPASTGSLEVEILPDAANRPNRVSFNAKLTNAIVPGFSAGGIFQNGEIAFESAGGSTLQFALYGQDRIETTYYNPNNRDRGTWSLTRRPTRTPSASQKADTARANVETVRVADKPLPPVQPIQDLKAITGEWKGTLTSPRGTVPYTLTIKEDGSWEAVSPNGRANGILRLEGGKGHFKSYTTGRNGTYTLHEGNGQRVLVIWGEGGVTGEVRPAK